MKIAKQKGDRLLFRKEATTKRKSSLSPFCMKLSSGEKYTRLFSKKDGSAISLRSGCVVLMPGENVGEHSTEAEEELLIILEGKGKLSLGKTAELDIEKDSAVYIPPRTLHDVKNTGKEGLKYVFVTA